MKIGTANLRQALNLSSRPSGEWSEDDFDVLAGGAVVGRIFKGNAAPIGRMWTLTFGHHENRTRTHGYTATREAAMAAFAKSWRGGEGAPQARMAREADHKDESLMELHRIILSKSKLAALPQAERSVLLLLGHASNEINVLSKLILMVMRKDTPPSQIADHVETGQVCVLLRILIGKLHEAWELFKNRVQADRPLAAKYVPQLDEDSATALTKLNKHFGKGSPLTEIRNKIAFHYKDHDNLTEQSFRSIADTESLEFYLTNVVGNSFYHASEQITMFSAIKMAMPGTSYNEAQAFSELCRVVIEVSHEITELFGQLIGAILATMPNLERQIENHPDGPKLSTLSLPYFVEFDATKPALDDAPASSCVNPDPSRAVKS